MCYRLLCCHLPCLCFYPKGRVEKRKRDKALTAEGNKRKKKDKAKAEFAAKVDVAAAQQMNLPEQRPPRRRALQAQMCATAEENRATGCLEFTTDLMPCPGPDAGGVKPCVSEDEAMFLCKVCKKRWQCMCHHCNKYAQKILGECFFCRLKLFSHLVFLQKKG